MRYQRILSAMFMAVALSASAVPAFASVLASEDFEDYSAGAQLHTLNGGDGFLGAWNVPGAARQPEVTIVAGGLGYAAGDINVLAGANALQYLASENGIEVLASRQFPTTSGTVYFSFLYQQSQQDTSSDFNQLGLINTAGGNPTVSALDDGRHKLRSGTSSNVDTGIGSDTGTTYMIVVKAAKSGGSPTYNDLTMWVDPVSSIEGFNVVDAHSTVNSGLSLDSAAYVSIRKAFTELNDTFLYDNLVIADTFHEAVGVAGTVQPDYIFTTADGQGADAYVRGGASANTNFGSETVMQSKFGNSTDVHRQPYFRFDISSIHHEITDATVRLSVDSFIGENSNADWTFNVYGLADGHAGENWSEAAITWNNAPGNDTATAGVNLADVYGNAALASFTLTGPASNTGVEINTDDFPDLLAFLNADTDGRVTFIVTRVENETVGGSTIVHQFWAKEGAGGDFAPALALNVYIPEPGSLSLLALAGAALMRRRR